MRLSPRVVVGLALCFVALAYLKASVQAQAPGVAADGGLRTEQAGEFTLFLPYLAYGWDWLTPLPPTATASAQPPTGTPTVTPSPTATGTRFRPLHPTMSPTPTPTSTTSPPGALLVLDAVADTFLTEGRPSTAWGGFPGLFIGYDWQAWLRQRPLVRFDLSPLPPDALVLSARLEVYIHNCFECYRVEVTAYRVTQAWDEATATWESAAESFGEPYGRSVLDPREGRHWEGFDITDLVRVWASGGPNEGVMLRGGEEPVTQDPLRYDFWGIEAREGQQFPPRLMIRWLPQ